MLVARGIMSGEVVSEDPVERNVEKANETGMEYAIDLKAWNSLSGF